MLVASGEVGIGEATMCSTILLERAVRAHVVTRRGLVFDSSYSPPARGKVEQVGHVMLLVTGRIVIDRRTVLQAPIGVMLADDELERRRAHSRTFRTDGARVQTIHLRFHRRHVRVPIGLAQGTLALSPASWNAAAAMVDRGPAGDLPILQEVVLALERDSIITSEVAGTLCTDEPDRFRRAWSALQPLYASTGAATSLKQLAATLNLSVRQTGRDINELAATFGLHGYRDALRVIRIRLAAILLSAPTATVAAVAREIGYGSVHALERAFRDAKLPPPTAVQDAVRR